MKNRKLENRYLKMSDHLRWVGIVAVLLFVFGGCSSINGREGGATAQMTRSGKSPLYYDFGDVLIPGELKIDKGSTFVYRTPGFTAGVIALKGRVDINSLVAFFEGNMPRDGWRQVSSFRSPHNILLFQKESRLCMIIISDGKFFSTRAEIWVAPTNPMGGAGEDGLLK